MYPRRLGAWCPFTRLGGRVLRSLSPLTLSRLICSEQIKRREAARRECGWSGRAVHAILMDTMAMRRSSATAVPHDIHDAPAEGDRPPRCLPRAFLFELHRPESEQRRCANDFVQEGFEEGREATRSEIWFGGPETFEKILLMRRQRWERDQEERVRDLRQIGGRSRRRRMAGCLVLRMSEKLQKFVTKVSEKLQNVVLGYS